MTLAEALDILELSDKADSFALEDIKRQYRKLMVRLHPDHGGSGGIAKVLNEARDVLKSDLAQRAKKSNSRSGQAGQSERDAAEEQSRRYEERERKKARQKAYEESEAARRQRQDYERREREKRGSDRGWNRASGKKKTPPAQEEEGRVFVTESVLLFVQYLSRAAGAILVLWIAGFVGYAVVAASVDVSITKMSLDEGIDVVGQRLDTTFNPPNEPPYILVCDPQGDMSPESFSDALRRRRKSDFAWVREIVEAARDPNSRLRRRSRNRDLKLTLSENYVGTAVFIPQSMEVLPRGEAVCDEGETPLTQFQP